MRAACAALLLLLAACATQPEPPRERALPLLGVLDGKLGWADLSLGMTRSAAEKVLHRKLLVQHDPYFEICGEYYSVTELHGRRIRIDWSAATPDGTIEVIAVPYGGGDRVAYDVDLSQAALAAVAELTAEVPEEGGDSPPRSPSFLVLRSDPEQAVNLKSSGEGVFFLTYTACVD